MSRVTKAVTSALGAALILAAVPSGASAQAQNPDSYLFPYAINQPNTTLEKNTPAPGYAGTTVGRGEQADLFNPPSSGGLGENIGCQGQGTVWYGATEWWRFHPHRNGVVAVGIQGSGFAGDAGGPVIAFMRVLSDGNPDYTFATSFRCFTGDTATKNVTATYPLQVVAGATYAIQVGARRSPNSDTGTPSTGTYTLNMAYDPDSDSDGVLDSGDRCPEQGGRDADKHQGCPDGDGDGLIDREDSCPGESGDINQHRGCPDGDGDGFPEGSGGSDKCPGLTGPNVNQHQGCPDADRDGVAEGAGAVPRDICENLDPEAVDRVDRKPRDGCPDNLKIETAPFHRGRTYAGGVFVTALGLKLVPRDADVRMTCRLPGGRRCGRLTIDGAKKKRVGFKKKLTRKRLPFGTRINAKVTARYATDRFIRIKVTRRETYRSRCGSSLKKLGRCD